MQIFNSFARMIRGMPPTAIPRALDLECKMLNNDATNERFDAKEDVLSILCFGRFVQLARIGGVLRFENPLPLDHIEFYKEVTVRLVKAKELPEQAMTQFDYAFWRVI